MILIILVADAVIKRDNEDALRYYEELRSLLASLKARKFGRYNRYSAMALTTGLEIHSLPL